MLNAFNGGASTIHNWLLLGVKTQLTHNNGRQKHKRMRKTIGQQVCGATFFCEVYCVFFTKNESYNFSKVLASGVTIYLLQQFCFNMVQICKTTHQATSTTGWLSWKAGS